MTAIRKARALLVASALLAAAPAFAQPSPQEAAAAEKLFKDALELMVQKRFAEACSMLEQSQKIDPGLGTMLNLALCYEELGRTASAWGLFREVAARAKGTPRADRVQTAQEHADALAPKLSYLEVRVSPKARVQGLVVAVDGKPRDPQLYGVALPADPGEHVVEATAPGRGPLTVKIVLGATSDRKSVEVGELEPLPAPSPEPVKELRPTNPEPPAPSATGQKTLGWILIGSGAVLVGTGAAFGVLAVKQNEESVQCGKDPACDFDHGYAWANRYAWVANITLPLGLISAGVGTYLLVSAPKQPASAPGARLVPNIATSGAGMKLEGTW